MTLPINCSDFDLVDGVFKRVADKKDATGVASLTPPERIVYFIWAAIGIIENGSFQYFFENEMDGDVVADSLDALGFPSAAGCFREAKRVLSDRGDLVGWDHRLRFLQEHEKTFDLLALRILQNGKDIETKLATYIRSQPTIFEKS